MILVTGATGILGAHLLYELLKKNDKVVATYRNKNSIEKTKKIFSFYNNNVSELLEKITWRKVDVSNYFEVFESFEDVTHVYHCAAYVGFKNSNREAFFNTNVEGTKNIVDACLTYNVEKLCHVSSIATIKLNDEGLTTEKEFIDPEQAKTNYSLTKYYAELEVWRGIKEGLNAVIVNPSVIIAPYLLNKTAPKWLKKFHQKGLKYHTCGKKGYISVYDLVSVMQKLMASEISGERFLISSENSSFKTLINIFNKLSNNNLKSKKLSLGFLNLIRYVNTIFSFGNPLINKVLIEYAINDELYTSEKLLSTIDFKFESIETTMQRVLKIYKAHYFQQ